MRRLRTFIGLPLPEATRDQISQGMDILRKKNIQNIKWVEPEQLHITMLFLGHITQARMEAASKAAEKAAKETLAFNAYPNGLSYFYKKGADSVIFLDISDKEKSFRQLYKTLVENLLEEEFYPPTRFTPHITLGRLKRKQWPHERKKILLDITESEVPQVDPFPIDSIIVYESIYAPGANKQRYHLLKSFPLGGKGKETKKSDL